jgi:hypothetical protein
VVLAVEAEGLADRDLWQDNRQHTG